MKPEARTEVDGRSSAVSSGSVAVEGLNTDGPVGGLSPSSLMARGALLVVAGLVMAGLVSALGLGRWVLPAGLASAAWMCWINRGLDRDDRARGFWQRWAAAFFLWTLAAVGDTLLSRGAFDAWLSSSPGPPSDPGLAMELGMSTRIGRARGLALGLDFLHLFGYLPIFLGLDLRPSERRSRAHPEAHLRQLQLAGFLGLLLALGVYFWLLPESVGGGRLGLGLLTVLDIGVAAALLIGLQRGGLQRGGQRRWQRVLLVLVGAVLALTFSRWLAGFPWPAAPSPLRSMGWALGPVLAMAAAWSYRLAGSAVGMATGSAGLSEGSGPPGVTGAPSVSSIGARASEFAVPLVITASILPVFHLLASIRGSALPELADDRALLVLVVSAVLVPLALGEQALLRRRSSQLEIEQRRATDETEERSMYLSSLIEHSPLAIVVLDPSHRVRLCNPAFERLFLYRSDEVVGSTLDGLIAEGSFREEASSYTKAVQSGSTVHATTCRLRSDGTKLEVEVYGVPMMRDGAPIGIFAIYQDVTDRMRAEHALRESEERFRRLSEAAFEGIVVSDEGRIRDCNRQYAALVGLTPGRVIGATVRDFVDPSDWPMVQAHMRHGYERPYEHRALRADGTVRVVEARGRSVPFEGRYLRVTAVRDVTDHKRFEQEVRQAQKMEAVGRMAGGIAHDFNNLLTVIKGYGQLLSMQMDEGKLKGLVAEVLQAAERASLMTRRLLAFGRKQQLQSVVLELDELVLGMQEMLRRLIRADIRFDIQLDSGGSRVKADPSQLEQVVLNLAINAGDAMPEGGVLSLSTSAISVEDGATAGRPGPGEGSASDAPTGAALPESTVAPGLSAGSYVCLRVRDTGLGMDELTRGQIFEPFFTTKKKGKGTGLGLATVYAIVKQSGGSIDVSSRVGEGTTFSIYLPRVPEAASETGVAGRVSDLPTGNETVLVVEDEPGVRSLVVEFLELHGYRVFEAEDGKEGLRRLRELGDEVDLLLTDVVMPSLNGPEMVRRLHTERPTAKVLYMSGYTDEVLARDDPAVLHRLVHKPFSVEELMVKVRAALDEPSRRISSSPP